MKHIAHQFKVSIIALISLVTLLAYQNCSEVRFSNFISEICPKGMSCEEVNFKTSAAETYPLIKVVFLVDNSFSMEILQQKLATSLERLYEGFEGKTLEFHVLTTTQIPTLTYGQNQAVRDSSGALASFMNQTSYQYQLNGQIHFTTNNLVESAATNAFVVGKYATLGNYLPQIFAPENPVSEYPTLESYDFNEDGFIDANDYHLRAFYDDVCAKYPRCVAQTFSYIVRLMQVNQVLAQKIIAQSNDGVKYPLRVSEAASVGLNKYALKLLQNYIQNIGVSGGDREVGICNLARLVTSTDVIQEGDKVAFIILSNENDQSTVESCIKEQRIPASVSQSVDFCGSQSCDISFNKKLMGVNYKPAKFVVATCRDGYRDGTQEEILKETAELLWTGTTSASANLCDLSMSPQTCSSTDIATAQSLCTSKNRVYKTCQIKCASSAVDNYDLLYNRGTGYYWDVPANACTSGAYMADIQAAAPKRIVDIDSCHLQSYKMVNRITLSPSQLENTQFVPAYAGNSNLASVFKTTLDNKIGLNNYFLGAIIHDPVLDAQHCQPSDISQGSSAGTKYKNLVSDVLGWPNVVSICAPSYNPIIEEFRRFASLNINRQFVMGDMTGKTLVSVGYRRQGAYHKLSESDYIMSEQTLTINDGILQQTDQLVVIIGVAIEQ